VPCNRARVQVIRLQVARLWDCMLCRRSQAKHLSWQRRHKVVADWLPSPSLCHRYQKPRLIFTPQCMGRVRQVRVHGSVEGVPADGQSL